jgi:hypothetical protein
MADDRSPVIRLDAMLVSHPCTRELGLVDEQPAGFQGRDREAIVIGLRRKRILAVDPIANGPSIEASAI